MKNPKKVIAILAILAVVCISAFAVDAKQTPANAKDSGWSINAGTAYGVSHIGASYNLGRWEFGGNLFTGFPNLAIISCVNAIENGDEMPTFLEAMQLCFIAYAGNISAMYDVTKSDKFDVDFGFALSGLSTGSVMREAFSSSGFQGAGVISVDVAARLKWNLNDHSGIYAATELPLAGIFIANQTESETNENTTGAIPFAVLTPEFIPAALILMLYTTRIGYVYSFKTQGHRAKKSFKANNLEAF